MLRSILARFQGKCKESAHFRPIAGDLPCRTINGRLQATPMPENGPEPTEPLQTPPPADRTRDLRARADRADLAAEFNLGWCLTTGHGGRRDEGQGTAWYRKA